MIKNILLFVLSFLFLFSSTFFSQNRTIQKKRKPESSHKSAQQNITTVQRKPRAPKRETSKRNVRNESRKNIDEKLKIRSPKKTRRKNPREKTYSKRPKKITPKYPPKRKKIIKPIPVENEVIIVEEIIYIDEPNPSKGYCGGSKMWLEDYYVSDEIYPDFNMRFVYGSIQYDYTFGDKHYYKIEIMVQPIKDVYFEKFGILIKYFNFENDLLFFNEHEEMLYSDEQYEFSKVIDLEYSGFVNLRIGYYNNFDKTFYPARYLGNKTDLSIYVREGGGNRIDIITRENEIR